MTAAVMYSTWRVGEHLPQHLLGQIFQCPPATPRYRRSRNDQARNLCHQTITDGRQGVGFPAPAQRQIVLDQAPRSGRRHILISMTA